jgi:hypothetical protein
MGYTSESFYINGVVWASLEHISSNFPHYIDGHDDFHENTLQYSSANLTTGFLEFYEQLLWFAIAFQFFPGV